MNKFILILATLCFISCHKEPIPEPIIEEPIIEEPSFERGFGWCGTVSPDSSVVDRNQETE